MGGCVGGIGNKCAQTIHLCTILYALFNIRTFQSALLLNIDPLFLYVELFPHPFLCPVVCPIFRARLLLGGSQTRWSCAQGSLFSFGQKLGMGLGALSLPAL